jgi:transposase
MPAGRPSKLTPELTKRLCDWLEAGNFIETACDMEGISRESFYEWLRRGERAWSNDIEPVNYVQFSDMVKKAMARMEILTINDLRAGPMNWQAKAWWLERRHPDRWGNRQKHEHTGKDGDAIEVRHVSYRDGLTTVTE